MHYYSFNMFNSAKKYPYKYAFIFSLKNIQLVCVVQEGSLSYQMKRA